VNLDLQLSQAIYEHFGLRLPLNIFIASEVPPGTGLGSSSATTVTLCQIFSTLSDQPLNKRQLAELAYTIETERLGAPIGKQDQYAAAYGGLNCIEFSADGVRVSPLSLPPGTQRTLEQRIMLFYTGATRQARAILAEQRDQTQQGTGRTIEALHQIKALGWQIKAALEHDHLDRFGELLDQGWQQKKQLASGVTNALIDEAYTAARQAGALGGKITGAGGGGYLMLYCHEELHDAVRASLEQRGLRQLRFAFEAEGSRVVLNSGGVMRSSSTQIET
jgi:D-glycero-alpha-D-manno-heptose-7-phosphate kinase